MPTKKECPPRVQESNRIIHGAPHPTECRRALQVTIISAPADPDDLTDLRVFTDERSVAPETPEDRKASIGNRRRQLAIQKVLPVPRDRHDSHIDSRRILSKSACPEDNEQEP